MHHILLNLNFLILFLKHVSFNFFIVHLFVEYSLYMTGSISVKHTL
jgi:hypothetical protein